MILYIHVYMYVYVCVCMYMYVCYMFVCMYVCMYIYIYIYISTSKLIRLELCGYRLATPGIDPWSYTCEAPAAAAASEPDEVSLPDVRGQKNDRARA